MISELIKIATERGVKLSLTPVSRLLNAQLVPAITRNGDWGEIHPFFIKRQDCTVPDAARSVLLLAIPLPLYYDCEFHQDGQSYRLYGLSAMQPGMTAFAGEWLRRNGYFAEPAANLRLKRLAVQSGLAAYGRNNITYVAGIGSLVQYAAFYTGLDIQDDGWREVCLADPCADCDACVRSCPTGAIRTDRILIDSYHCYAGMSEDASPFPDWVPKSAHQTICNCVKCQVCCPMNQPLAQPGELTFDEQETALVLNGAPYGDVTDEMAGKIQLLGLERWPASIPRNIRLAFERIDQERSQ